MGGRREWATTGYRIRLAGETDFLRVRIRVERGTVVRFVIQYEAVIDGRVYPAVRYDSAHGVAHRDTLDWEGQSVEKRWISDKTYGQVATEAINDIKANWQTYRDEFERRKP